MQYLSIDFLIKFKRNIVPVLFCILLQSCVENLEKVSISGLESLADDCSTIQKGESATSSITEPSKLSREPEVKYESDEQTKLLSPQLLYQSNRFKFDKAAIALQGD